MGELRLRVARRKATVGPGRNHPSTIIANAGLPCFSAQPHSSPSCKGVSSISRDTCKTSVETTTSINRDGFVMVQPKAFCRAAAELAQAGAQPNASTGDPTMDALAVRGPGLPPPPPGTQYSPTIYGAPAGARTASDSTVA